MRHNPTDSGGSRHLIGRRVVYRGDFQTQYRTPPIVSVAPSDGGQQSGGKDGQGSPRDNSTPRTSGEKQDAGGAPKTSRDPPETDRHLSLKGGR
jgi:hypothetical protein